MESDSHLNLRWDDHTSTFVHLLDHFRLQELYCDASLACAGGGVYRVHQVVLSACSDFFASIFASSSCQNPVVVLQDVATEHLEALLTYVYRGQVLLARTDLPAFLKVAESLQVKGLAPPPLIPLPQDTWGTSEGVSPPHDAPRYAPPEYSYPDPQQYVHPDKASSPPVRSTAPWESEGVSGSGAPLQTPPRPRGCSQGDGDKNRPPRKRYSPHFTTEQFVGTFQNLVASEEGGIKEEPLDEEELDTYESGKLTICEREDEEEEEEEEMEEDEEDVKEEQEEGRRMGEEKQSGDNKPTQQKEESKEDGDDELIEVKIMLDTKERLAELHIPDRPPDSNSLTGTTPSPSPTLSPSLPPHTPSPSLSITTLSPTPGHHALSPSQPHNGLSPIPALPAFSPVQATAPTNTSQLRRELLKPLQQQSRAAPQPYHAIPHPVIAIREEEEGGGGGSIDVQRVPPPPLVKIPSSSPSSVSSTALSHHYQRQHQHLHLHQLRQSDGRETTTTTTTTTATTTTNPNKPQHHHHHHHLLVTTQPTYRARLPPLPTATQPRPPQYLPTLTPLKDVQVLEMDAPLNLSQDTHTTHHHHHHHRHRNTGEQQQHGGRSTRDRDPFLGKILTNRKRRLRGPKSWEYLVRLLRDPSTNPHLIRWENEVKGVFRLVQPAIIAQRWGRRTGKHASECLTYENFARGLRYHYATGALEPVSERSFVYKFGPKAQMALGDGQYAVSSSTATPTATTAVSAAAAAAMTQL